MPISTALVGLPGSGHWFSGWHKHRQRRQRVLWEGRFKSVLVECGQALLTILEGPMPPNNGCI